MASDKSWKKIWDDKKLYEHDFSQGPVIVTVNLAITGVPSPNNTNAPAERILTERK